MDARKKPTGQYDQNNVQHRDYIKNQVAAFNQSFQALTHIDKKIGMGTGATTVLWAAGFLSTGVSIVLTIGIYLYVSQYANRHEQATEFHKQLNTLQEIYLWCNASIGRKILKDDNVLPVLEAIAPFTPSIDHLILWKDLAEDEVSDKFINILSKPPHNIRFINLRSKETKVSAPSYFGNLFSIAKENIENKTESEIKQTMPINRFHFRLFKQSAAEVALAIYGSDMKEDDKKRNTLS